MFQLANTRTERQIAKERYEQDQQIAKQRYEQDQQIALDKQHEVLLQAYLDRMSELLLKEKLRSSEVDAEVRNVARVRTITVLNQLDARRIGYVFAFLREAKLISAPYNDNVVSLKDADLHEVNWSHSDLVNANLSQVDLSGAYFNEANLSGAYLFLADLSGAYLRKARLVHTDLSSAILIGTDLSGAMLREADLGGADLRGADLSSANLEDTIGITSEELEKQAKSLKGATMPNGSIHP